MITSLELIDFKNFSDETLRMGPFTVIVGANASGKSNIRDAFRFLHGIGRGYSVPDIVYGKHGVGGQIEWEPIRGAPDEIVRIGNHQFVVKVSFDEEEATYAVGVGHDSEKNGFFPNYSRGTPLLARNRFYEPSDRPGSRSETARRNPPSAEDGKENRSKKVRGSHSGST